MSIDNNLKSIFEAITNDNLDKALQLCEQFINKQNEHIIFNFKGAIFLKKKDFDLAIKFFLKSTNSKADFIDPYKNLFMIYDIKKEFNQLLEIAKKIYNFEKSNPIYNFQLGYALEKCGQITESLKYYEFALNLGFKNKLIICNNIGNIYLKLNKIKNSIKYFKLGFEADGQNKIIINNLIRAYLQNRDLEEARSYLEKAKNIDPNYEEYNYNKAEYFFLIFEFEKAIKILKKQIFEKKDIKNNLLLCRIYFNQGKKEEGNQLIEKFYKENPNNNQIKNFVGIRYLCEGKFEKGWEFYEFRKQNLDDQFPFIKKWDGENLDDKIILVYNEQGIGDAIQFSKLLFPLKKLCKEIHFLINEKFIGIFKEDHNGIKVLTTINPKIIKYDYKITLGSLNKFFYKDMSNIENSLIKIDEKKVENFKKKLINLDKLNIGTAWSGAFTGINAEFRAIPFSKFQDLLSLNANFYCLQKDIWERDTQLFNKSNIYNFGNLLLNDLTSFIRNLDLVITSDTSILHFSASIGKETWALLPLDCDWRWGKILDYFKYNNLKIYRQQKFNSWEEVISNVKEDLQKRINKN